MLGSVLGGLGGGIGNIAILGGAAGRGGIRELKQGSTLWDKITQPDFDPADLTWEELRQLSQESPTLYNAIVPEEVKTAVDSPGLQADQMAAVSQMGQIAREGMPLADKLAAQEAGAQVSDANRRSQLAVLRDMAQRGRMGAGDEIQARLAASQQSGALARGLASDLAQQSAARRMAGISAYGQMAGNVRGQNFQQSLSNANVVNNFNNMVAQMRNQAAMENAAAMTRAQAANAATTQRLGEANALGRMQTQEGNLARRNQLKQNAFNNAIKWTMGKTGALKDISDARYDEQAAKAQTIRGIGQGFGQGIGGIGGLIGGV